MIFKRVLLMSLLFTGFYLLPGTGNAEQQVKGKPLLSDVPHLRTLLVEEMRALQQALNRIVIALPQGEWTKVAASAKGIHDSFIFQKKLTPKDRDILHHRLPAEFVHLDLGLHQRAARLQESAMHADAELSIYHLSRMMEACIQCHKRFATHRFPVLKDKTESAPHH
jgi:hypothetical protein